MLSVPSCKWSRSLGGEYVDGASCIYAVFVWRIPGALGQAEYFYPGFNEAFNEITNKEIKLWERIFVKAVETKEIRSDVNPSTLALTFRILLFGKCFQDALVNGLRIEELKVVLYNQYELIKN